MEYLKIKTENIYISHVALTQIIGVAIAETPGVCGIIAKDITGNIKRFIKKENFWYGIKIRERNEKIDIACHLILAYGTPIPTITNLIIENVKNILIKDCNIEINKVFIYVDKILLDQ